MTIDEFKATRFNAGMFALHRGHKYRISSVDFGEWLIELKDGHNLQGEPFWVRCENVEIIS